MPLVFFRTGDESIYYNTGMTKGMKKSLFESIAVSLTCSLSPLKPVTRKLPWQVQTSFYLLNRQQNDISVIPIRSVKSLKLILVGMERISPSQVFSTISLKIHILPSTFLSLSDLLITINSIPIGTGIIFILMFG